MQPLLSAVTPPCWGTSESNAGRPHTHTHAHHNMSFGWAMMWRRRVGIACIHRLPNACMCARFRARGATHITRDRLGHADVTHHERPQAHCHFSPVGLQ